MDACFDYEFVFKQTRRQRLRPVSADRFGSDVLRSLAHPMHFAFGDDITVMKEHDAVGHHIHFVQDVARNDEVHPCIRELAEKANYFRTRHRVEAVQGFIQYEHRWVMRDRLGEPDALPHAFTERRNFTVRRATMRSVESLLRISRVSCRYLDEQSILNSRAVAPAELNRPEPNHF